MSRYFQENVCSSTWFGCWNSDGWILVYVFVAVLGLIWFLSWLFDDTEYKAECRETIEAMNYDFDDVEVFVDNSRFSMYEFMKSKSVRKQYERWRSGHIALESEKSDGGSNIATGVAIGMIAGSAGHHS